jgi:two-component system chemotaxis response regulator CheY
MANDRCIVPQENSVAAIIVIDDDPNIRTHLREILESEGHEIREAQNGVYGIRTQRESPADLILCDIFMPDKEGLETVRELRAEFPALKIVAMGGDSPWGACFDFLAMAKVFGASATLEKPIHPQRLLATINRVLEA